MRPVILSFALVAALALGGAVTAQPETAERTTLQTQEFPAPLHTVTVRIEIAPGAEVAPHTHPGAEMGYIVSGEAGVTIGEESPKTLRAGDSFKVAPETVHSVKSQGASPLIILSTYVVDPTKPLASPAK
jgi:quercetin dioxygenase-like cupin family protein